MKTGGNLCETGLGKNRIQKVNSIEEKVVKLGNIKTKSFTHQMIMLTKQKAIHKLLENIYKTSAYREFVSGILKMLLKTKIIKKWANNSSGGN